MNKFRIAFLALAGVIAASLHAKPVNVEVDGVNYLVTGLDTGEQGDAEPRFVATVEGQPGYKYLPVEQRTCNLILPRVIWATASEGDRATAAGAGARGD